MNTKEFAQVTPRDALLKMKSGEWTFFTFKNWIEAIKSTEYSSGWREGYDDALSGKYLD